MPSSRFGGALTLSRLRCWQPWAFIMAATSITVESSGLAFCHMSATSPPAQSVQNKCRTGSHPSNCCPPRTMASVNTDFGIKLVAQLQTPLFPQNQPTCLSNHFLFILIISHYWLFHTVKHDCLGPDSSVNSHVRHKLCTNTQSCHLKWRPTFSF